METYDYGDLAREAGDTVEERAEQYGPPEVNLEHVADLWSAYLGVEVSGWDYAAMMMLAKMARAKDGRIDEDTAKDIAGYADAGWATVVGGAPDDRCCTTQSPIYDVEENEVFCQSCGERPLERHGGV